MVLLGHPFVACATIVASPEPQNLPVDFRHYTWISNRIAWSLQVSFLPMTIRFFRVIVQKRCVPLYLLCVYQCN